MSNGLFSPNLFTKFSGGEGDEAADMIHKSLSDRKDDTVKATFSKHP